MINNSRFTRQLSALASITASSEPKQRGESMSFLDALLSEFPECPSLLLQKAVLIQLVDDEIYTLPDVMRNFEMAMSIDPEYLECLKNLAFFVYSTEAIAEWKFISLSYFAQYQRLVLPQLHLALKILNSVSNPPVNVLLTADEEPLKQIELSAPAVPEADIFWDEPKDDLLIRNPGNGRLILRRAEYYARLDDAERQAMAEADLLSAAGLWTYRTEAMGKLASFYDIHKRDSLRASIYAAIFYCTVIPELYDLHGTIVRESAWYEPPNWIEDLNSIRRELSQSLQVD